MRINNDGDDLFHNRLFSYLQKQLAIPIEEIRRIRKQVFSFKSETTDYILKGFPTYPRLKVQEEFITLLKQEGFDKTYSFYQLAKYPPLHFENTFYSCLQYLQPSDDSFTFHKRKNQLEGLDVLDEFHKVTEKFVHHFQQSLPPFKQLEKWNERTAVFLNHLPIIKYYVQKEIINELLVWADWSLKGIQRETHFFTSGKKVILHGDVAHHNFLRTKNNELFLIDFDLISLGFPHSDILQYTNRILPYLRWSFHELVSFDKIRPFLHEKGFLFGLGYPTDIFREWNRAIREKSYLEQGKMQILLEMTVGQFKERQEFFKQIQYLAG
ncbi:phosphotransferase [Cytobacillus depressus]|nr:phosphotransferase [Cytobacillus depressus]